MATVHVILYYISVSFILGVIISFSLNSFKNYI